MRPALIATLLALPSAALAQEPAAPEEPAPEAQAAEQPEAEAAEPPVEAPAPEAPAVQAPKIAIVVAGDPDDVLRNGASRVERAVEGALRLPFDPGLRAALRGEPGEADDGLEEVRRERRRLGLSEAGDAPLLASLGRRAGAVAVAVVRTGPEGPELVVLDVRNAQFFEGALALGGASDERVSEFAARRARVAARGALIAAPVAPRQSAPVAATQADAPPREPVAAFFEDYWPYMVAGALLIGMIVAIAVTSTTDGSSQPVLRFVPGGR